MAIQHHKNELTYVNRKTEERPGNFLENFLDACLAADDENYEILRPALLKIMVKYPARCHHERLDADGTCFSCGEDRRGI